MLNQVFGIDESRGVKLIENRFGVKFVDIEDEFTFCRT